jgi:lipopolysaccharide export system protein LptA
MNHWHHKLWLGLLLLPLSVHAAKPASPAAEKPAPITIEADQLELDQNKGTSLYRGNVVLQRGTLQIKADSITIHSAGKKLQWVQAKGNPVYLDQGATADAGPMHAEASQIEYQPQNEVVKLQGRAQLWRDGNEFSGEQIRYDLKRKLVKASGDKEGESRVRVLLQPESTEQNSKEKP